MHNTNYTPYNRWLWGNDCCCNDTHNVPCTGDDCSCEAIYLEISNVKTDVNVVSGEVENKQDKLTAGTGIEITENNVINCTVSGSTDLSEYYTKDEVDTLIPTNVSELVNDAGYINQLKTINGESLIGEGDIIISGGSVTVDDHIDSASTNPVENKAIYGALNGKLDATAYTPTDLSNYYNKQQVDALIPTVPTSNSAFTNDMHYITSGDSVFNNYATTANTYTKTEVDNKFWCGTQAEYDALTVKLPDTLYLIYEI